MAKDLDKRFKNVQEIKNHKWFNGVNWDDLLNKRVCPPYLPSIYESNFDKGYSDLPVDFEEYHNPNKRFSTERRLSYYYESTIQSRKITENSFYFQRESQQVELE